MREKMIKRNNITKCAILFLALILLFAFGGISYATDNTDNAADSSDFSYAITPDDEEWANYETKQEMVDVCRISDKVLSNMSTKELFKAVMEYPFVIDIYFFNTYQDGLNALLNESDAFVELTSKKDAGSVMLKTLEEKQAASKDGEETLDELTIKILLTEKNIYSNLTKEEQSKLLYLINPSSSKFSFYVQTPEGTDVAVLIESEGMTSAQITNLNNNTQSSYPHATYISTSTTKYNCHSYAWFSTSTYNTCWMDDPSAYMTDGSYDQFGSVIDAGPDDKLYYANGNHSAIVYQYGGPLSDPKYLTVTSKWGPGPVMRHGAYYSPYNSTGITMWELN